MKKKRYEVPQTGWYAVTTHSPLAQSGLDQMLFSVHGVNNELNAGEALSRQCHVW